ncbi:helix-turn-helix domain-containing protein [Actinomadura spongiicola]|uniref:Helix-turn-helix domain-containing protein n=1 Tax=Actinomadura spongiicola TaxID=2303421 RepID=A0A372GN74_9ACTN|nr:helix-turn-helix domain-containing protein [Actinomadura spongiicola]RFS86795.1 helix-turn-helix domain-containing protein [Actinomadura spongiicola]
MSDDTAETVGRRVARARKKRDLTQLGLAQRASYSRSHVSQVEAGHKVATPAFVAAVAAALGVDPAEIYGQPFRARGHDDQVHSALPELRRVLVYVDVGPELAGPPRSLDVLAAEVATARRLIHKAQLTKLARRLPAVLEELTYWAHETNDPRAWLLLSRAFGHGVSLTRRLGYSGDALALLERGADAARRSGDPNLPHLVTLARALLSMGMNQYQPALTSLDQARADIAPDRPDADEVAGALDLRAAIIAARSSRGSNSESGRAWDYFGRADERIKQGRGRPVHGLEFTAANVAVHGAAVAAELGDLDEAARRDRDIGDRTLSALPPERRTHHEIDMARVLIELGDYGKAESRIESADRIAPQMVTFHPTARAVVAHLVDVRRTLPESLRRLHLRMSA